MMAQEGGGEETEGYESRLEYLSFQGKDINTDKFNRLIGEIFKIYISLKFKAIIRCTKQSITFKPAEENSIHPVTSKNKKK